MTKLADSKNFPERTEWLSLITKLRSDWYNKYQPLMESDAKPIRPERLCQEISNAAPKTQYLWWIRVMQACGWGACLI